MITKEINFLHEQKENHFIWLSCEMEYSAGLTPKLDTWAVIGEITDNEANVYEINEKVIAKEFQYQFADEINEEREELHGELTSKLQDF